VQSGSLWLRSGPASVLAEEVPAGTLTAQAELREPPGAFAAADILPANLPDAWSEGEATGLSIATALSNKHGDTLPWKTVKDVIGSALNARFLRLGPASAQWPCEYPAASTVKLREPAEPKVPGVGGGGGGQEPLPPPPPPHGRSVEQDMEAAEIQDLADAVNRLLEAKNKAGCPLTFCVRITFGDETHTPDDASIAEVNAILSEIREDLQL